MMKKILFFTIAILTISFVKAQEISYGLKAGLNYSNWNFSFAGADYDARLAFHVGAVVEFGLSDKFAIQPELLYSSVGAKYTYDSSPTARAASDDTMVYALDYLSVPIMAKYYAAEGLSLEVGPQIGLLLSAKGKIGDESQDLKDELNSTDFGAAIGAGYKLENGLFFNARYVLGLSNILKDSGDEWGKNNAFQFSVGYKFN